MADNATHPLGAKLSYGTYDPNNPETPAASYTEIGQITEAAFPEITVGKMKATRLNQTSVFKRKRPGMADASDVSVKLYYDKTDYATLFGIAKARTEKWWKVEAPEDDDATHTSKNEFHGFITKLSQPIPDPESDTAMMIEMDICTNGEPQFTAYS